MRTQPFVTVSSRLRMTLVTVVHAREFCSVELVVAGTFSDR